LLVETFRLEHFTERIEGQEIVFDYTLHEGASPTRNAIRILEIAGFSPELVEEARRVALSLAEGSRGYPAHG
jgi:DNA mismatch repair ATPase MutS